MDIVNEIFNNLADKIPLEFLKGNFTVFGYAFSKLFAIAAALFLLAIILIAILLVLVSKEKKRKKAAVKTVVPASDDAPKADESSLSSSPVKTARLTDNTLQKAVATPNCEFELPPEDELSAAEQVVDIDQVIIDEMDEKDKAVMLDEFDFDIEIDALCDFDTELEDSEDDEEEFFEEELVQAASAPSVTAADTRKPYATQDTRSRVEPKKDKPRYERSFSAKLIQTGTNNKARYNVIKNMLSNYDKVRNSMSWNNESFISGKKLIARIYLIGKTLRVCFALNPADYSENIYHHEDKSATSKYKTVPMMIKIKSRLGLKRAVSLIIDLADKFGIKKSKKLKIVDYIAANSYLNDAELLKRGLIRPENPERYKIEKPAVKQEKPAVMRPAVKEAKALIAAADAAEKASGKYVFAKKADGIHFALIANNGQLLLESSSGYTSFAGAKRGVDTFIKTVKEGEFIIDDDKFGRYRFILKSKNSLATYTGEVYKTKAAAESSANSVKRFALTATIIPYEGR